MFIVEKQLLGVGMGEGQCQEEKDRGRTTIFSCFPALKAYPHLNDDLAKSLYVFYQDLL